MLICETTRHFLNIEDNIHVEFHSKERVQGPPENATIAVCWMYFSIKTTLNENVSWSVYFFCFKI